MNSPSSRREFVKKSLLGCAAATLVTEVAGGATAAKAKGVAKKAAPLAAYGSGEPIYLSDLDRCQPASALTREWTPNRWRLYDYEAAKTKGVLLAAGQNTGVPDLEYPLTQKGWYAIYFGIMSVRWESHLQVRLKRDPAFSILAPNNMAQGKIAWADIQWSQHRYSHEGTEQFEDLFWKYAQLDGANDSIIITQSKVQLLAGDPDARGNLFMPCWLGYIKLVPLSDSEVQALQADRRRSDTRRLYAADDAFTAQAFLHFKTEADVRRQIEPYRDTDFSRMYWEAGAGDHTTFPSKVGRLLTMAWTKEQYRIVDYLGAKTHRDLDEKGIDPFRVALEHCHEIGMEFHASYRVGGFEFPPPGDEMSKGGFYVQHPEWRCADASGQMLPRMSYAYDGVRQFVLSLFREIAGYPIDGLSILYNRRLPVLGYDAPLVAAFKARHGIDPRTLEERDPRWLALCAGVLTDFMKEVRALAREVEKQPGRKPIGITAVVMGSRDDNYNNGVDLETWVREGLIDTLIPYTSITGGIRTEEKVPDAPYRAETALFSWTDPKSAEFFLKLTRNTPCRLALDILPRSITAEDYKRLAHKLYEQGVENLFFWDCAMRTNYDRSWTALSRLGHREELAEWAAHGSAPVDWPRQPLVRLGNWDYRMGTPG